MIHGDAFLAYFNKMWDISLMVFAAILPWTLFARAMRESR